MTDDATKAVEDCHVLLLWLLPHLDQSPRQRRFTLGDRIETELLDVLGAAAYTRHADTEGLRRAVFSSV